jgi:hypothetical protein
MARLAVTLITAFLLLLPTAPQAQEKGEEKASNPAAPAGVWKLTLPMVRGDDRGGMPTWLVRFEEKEGKWTGSILAAAPGWTKTSMEKLTVSGGMVRFQLKSSGMSLPCDVKVGKDSKSTKLFGVTTVRKRSMPIELERTTLTALEPFDQLREMLAKQQPGHEAVQLALQLLGQSEAKKVKPAEARAWAEKAVKSAELYGPAWQRDVLLLVAQILTEEKGYEAIAVQYAQRAARMLEPKEPPTNQKRVLDVLAAALEKAGKEKEAKEIQVQLAKLDFRIKPKPYAGRKNKSARAILVELFTGAQCPPCVAADLAFDALGKTYKPSEVILLQYHLHIPDSDPLTSPDSEARAQFYEDSIRGTPTILFNGRVAAPGGGDRDDALEKYEEYVEGLDPLLETVPKAELKLSTTRKDGKITIATEVDKLAATGDEVRLRVVLIEEQVTYKGRNGLPVHHHVVRSMPGGADGTAIKEKSLKKSFTVDVAELKKKLTEYLDNHEKKRPFPNKERSLELKKLKVVAFVQNDRGGEVLQAVQVDVPTE